jgi:hypothetical protein
MPEAEPGATEVAKMAETPGIEDKNASDDN